MVAAIFAALWSVLADVLVGLLDREDFVDEGIEPELEALDPLDDAGLLARFDGLLDAD